jgi:hypothetical protein
MMQAVVTHIACDSFALVSDRKEDGDRQVRNKRRNEGNWRGHDRGMGADKYCRNAGDGGKKLFSV